MKKDVVKWDEYLKKYSGKYYRRSCIAALHIWYNDQLCKDMGWDGILEERRESLLSYLSLMAPWIIVPNIHIYTTYDLYQ
jgi:hypothetical protein